SFFVISTVFTLYSFDPNNAPKGGDMLKSVFIVLFSLTICIPLHAGRKSSGGYKSQGYGYTNPRSTTISGSVNRKTGTYTAPYRRTTPNGTEKDNYSTKGNMNPYSGKKGTKGADK